MHSGPESCWEQDQNHVEAEETGTKSHMLTTHRGAKVVAHFMCKGDMRDFGRNVGGVVLNGDDSSVERLLLAVRVQLAFLTDASGAPWDTNKSKIFPPSDENILIKKTFFPTGVELVPKQSE